MGSKKINWAKNLEELQIDRANLPEGDGWFTHAEFKENSKIGNNRASRILKAGISNGKIEVHRGSKWSETYNQNVRGIWYRFINPK